MKATRLLNPPQSNETPLEYKPDTVLENCVFTYKNKRYRIKRVDKDTTSEIVKNYKLKQGKQVIHFGQE